MSAGLRSFRGAAGRLGPGAAALSGSGTIHPAGHRIVHAPALALAAPAVLHAQGVISRRGVVHLNAPGTLAAAGDIPTAGFAHLHAPGVLYATAFTEFGEATWSASATLTASSVAGPDLDALWSAYLAAKFFADRQLANYKMMRQAGGTDGSAGFLYAKAYDAERDADLAYQAFQDAQRRVYAGAPG